MTHLKLDKPLARHCLKYALITYPHSKHMVLSAENERYFITHVLAFFAGSDGIVMENLAARFMSGQRPSSIPMCEV